MRHEVFAMMNMKITVFWDVTPWILVNV